MVFHSFQFLFVFLPLTYVGFLVAHRAGGWPAAFRFLAVASLVFYAQWGVALLAILMLSLVFNYAAGNVIALRVGKGIPAKSVLAVAIAANLGLLGYLKYTNFLIDIVNGAAGSGMPHLQLIVPIGVSFFTFVQIGYLIDAYNGQHVRTDFGRYVVFAAFFPCVTAGPLVLQREMFSQMGERSDRAFDPRRLAVGMTLFGMGLFKKVVLADSIAPYANQVFDGVAGGMPVDAVCAWIGSLSYALQLYFDFSGYSDMAIGLGLVFGLRLPLNFDSPFKATSISDFWRRWHMTMTRLFTNYIYSPLAMNNTRAALAAGRGQRRRFLEAAVWPVIATFAVAGIWHGAGWTFLVFGLIHGVAISVNLGWREFDGPKLPAPVGWALTMAVVVSGLVVFRAANFDSAAVILGSMWGLGAALHNHSWDLAGFASAAGLGLDVTRAAALIVLLGAVVLLLPNTQQILHRDWPSSDEQPQSAGRAAGLLAWRPVLPGAVAIGVAFALALTLIGADSTFLYYQF